MTLSPEQEERLRRLVQIFLEENKKINLSAFRTEEQCWVGNVLDSVAAQEIVEEALRLRASRVMLSPSTPLRSARDRRRRSTNGWHGACTEYSRSAQCDTTVIDIGTGGGFPLLPLAILFPDAHFTGLDATKKKINAIQRISDAMELKNVELVCGRAEELGHDPSLREQFDVVLARRIAPLAELLEYMSPFSKIGGQLLCWKSLHIAEELTASVEARMKLHARLTDKYVYELPGDWGKRQLLIFEKIEKLPGEFPRGVGEAKKKPL